MFWHLFVPNLSFWCQLVKLQSAYNETTPGRPIRYGMWIVKQMRYLTDQLTNQPTDTTNYRGALLHL